MTRLLCVAAVIPCERMQCVYLLTACTSAGHVCSPIRGRKTRARLSSLGTVCREACRTSVFSDAWSQCTPVPFELFRA